MPDTDTHLTFDAETHTYYYEGRVIPSVTQILKGVGIIDSSWFTEEARLRGQYVHEATHLDDMGTLDEDSLDDAIRPYVEQWRRFKSRMGVQIMWSELMVYNPIFGYAGTLDRTLSMEGGQLGLRGKGEILVDIKTGSTAQWHRLQTAAYQDALGRYAHRGTVILTPDNYKWETHTDPKDIEVFRSACAVHNWQLNNGIKDKGEKTWKP